MSRWHGAMSMTPGDLASNTLGQFTPPSPRSQLKRTSQDTRLGNNRITWLKRLLPTIRGPAAKVGLLVRRWPLCQTRRVLPLRSRLSVATPLERLLFLPKSGERR